MGIFISHKLLKFNLSVKFILFVVYLIFYLFKFVKEKEKADTLC